MGSGNKTVVWVLVSGSAYYTALGGFLFTSKILLELFNLFLGIFDGHVLSFGGGDKDKGFHSYAF